MSLRMGDNGKIKTRSFYGKIKEKVELNAARALGVEHDDYAKTEITVGQLTL